jgi:hypothetical protein
MKKMIIALTLLSAVAAFSAETPSVGTRIDENNSIVVSVSNNDNVDLECKYSVSYFVNTLTYRRQSGEFELANGGVVQIGIKNDKFDNLSRVHAKVHCE